MKVKLMSRVTKTWNPSQSYGLLCFKEMWTNERAKNRTNDWLSDQNLTKMKMTMTAEEDN